MNKQWIIIIVAIVAVLGVCYVIVETNRPVYFVGVASKQADAQKIEPSAWQPDKAIAPDDSTHVFRVTWSQKYGSLRTAYCKVVFKNDKEKQYKLIAPWMTSIDIERANMDDIVFEKISIDSVPEGIIK